MVKPLVRDYMTSEVVSINPDLTVLDAIHRVVAEGHVGLPVADGENLIGFVTPKELLRNMERPNAKLRDVIAKGTVVAHPDMDLDDCARVLFRMGVKELPVVDDEGTMVGIVSTTDIIRSHIERVTPRTSMRRTRWYGMLAPSRVSKKLCRNSAMSPPRTAAVSSGAPRCR